MAEEVEAAAELATGGLVANAVDRRQSASQKDTHYCLNCATTLVGSHCHNCGQSGHLHRSIGAIGHEIIHGVAHFEGKFWRTLPLLAWRPGELTRRYIEGERARFVSPMAIFLFSIFAMFAVFSWAGIAPSTDLNGTMPASVITDAQSRTREMRMSAVEARDALPAGDPERTRQEKQIAELDQTLVELDEALAEFPRITEKAAADRTPHVRTRDFGWSVLNKGIDKWNQNPSLMIYKLQTSSYKFSWLLIPLSLPFMWLPFAWRREYKIYDHTVFVTYSIAFMSLVFIVITILAACNVHEATLIWAALLIPPIHIARQLNQAYNLSWPATILRTFILSFFVLIIFTLFLSIQLLSGMT